MGYIKYVNILLLFMLIHMCSCNTNENQLNSYLKHRYQDVKVKLIESFNKYYRNFQDSHTEIIVHDTHTYYLPSIPVCFNMLNKTYLLMHDQIFTLSITHNAYLFEPHSTLPEVKHKISFIEVIEHEQNILAIVVFTNGYSHIYTYGDSNWNLLQKLPKGGIITDVCLFIQNDNLYLFVVNNIKYASVASILYKWTGTQFEESDYILTMEATSVSCFKNKNSEFIIVTQYSSLNINEVGTYVLEVNKGKMRKRHFLNSIGADKVITYVLNGERYIIVLNNGEESTIYWWDANYFMKWKQLKEPIRYQKVSVFYIRNNPVLFAATEDELIVYNLETENLNVIAKIPYQKYYWKVLTMDFTLLNDQIIIYVIGLDEENYPEMLFVSVSFETTQINSNSITNEDMIIKCFVNLNEKLNFRSDLLSHMKSRSKKILQKNKDEIYKGIISSYQDVFMKNNIIHNNYSYTYYKQYLPVKDKLKVLKDKINAANKQVKQLTGKVTITGKLYVDELKVPALQVNKINNKIWDPNIWLLKSKPQVIHSPVTARNVFSKQITTNNENSGLNDLLLVEGDQILTGTFKFNNLVAQNIYATRINNIPLSKVCRGNELSFVKDTKYIQNISVEKLHAATLNGQTTENVLHYMQNDVHYNFYYIKKLNIRNFNFDIINGIYWRDFSYSLFNTTGHNKIEGNVIIHSNVKINNLITKKLSNIDVDQLMTTSTDQTISSDMQLMTVNVENVITPNINGLSFKEHVATFYDNSYVTGPVTIKNIHVEGDVNGKEFPVQDFKDTNHLHMYEGHVKIIGSLTLGNVSLNAFTKLLYKNKELSQNYVQEYWLKNQEQIISAEIIALEGLSVSNLNTTYINDNSFVVFSQNYDKDNNFVYKFKNIKVNGNVTLHSDKNLKNIEQLLKQAVRKTGRYKVTGHKVFQNVLNIKNLHTAVVENVDIDNVAKVKKFNKFTGTKTFNKLIVQEDLILAPNYTFKIRELNKFPIIDLLNRTVYIHRPSYVNNLIFKNDIETSNVIFANANTVNVEKMTEKLINLYGTDRLEKVFIHGNMDVNNLRANNTNNINIDKYFSQLVFVHDNIFIDGDITFKKNVQINNLKADRINGINIKDAPEKYLSRKRQQIITGVYEIQNVESPYVNTLEINNIKTELFIDRTSKEDIHIYSNLEFMNLNCNSVKSEFFNTDMQEAAYGLTHLPGLHWTDVTVLKDINFGKASGNFGRIISHAVNALKNNILSEKVSFDHVFAKKIDLLRFEINGVNIKEIYDDALKTKDVNHQVVTGKNKFTRLSAAKIKILGNTNIKNINGVDIIRLNNTIIDQNHLFDSVILGHKQFTSDIEITNLKVPSKIHGVAPENIIEIHKNYDVAPNARFKNIEIVNDCNFDFIKFVNITHLLSQTMKCNTNTPQYIESTINFKNLVFAGNVTTNHINNIDVRNVVVDHGTQYIQNSKKFYRPLNIFGDFNVELLNGYRLSSIYNNAILTKADALIDTNVIFKKPTGVYANIKCSKINGIDIEKLKTIVEDSTALRTNITFTAFDELKKIVDYYSRYTSDYTYD